MFEFRLRCFGGLYKFGKIVNQRQESPIEQDEHSRQKLTLSRFEIKNQQKAAVEIAVA
jgi:hypothetical protein